MKSLRHFLQNELYNLFHSKSFLFVLLILLLIVTADDILAYKSYKDNLQLTLTTVDLQADGTFAEYPFLQIYTLYNSWIGGRANETLPMVFFYTMPVFVVIPYSWSYLAEEKNGYDRIMASQLGKASYFLGKYVSTFLSGALTVLLPMLFSFLLASCLVPAYRPDINFALYYQVSATKLLGNLYYAHPLCTAFLNMLMIGIFAGAWATIPLALSFFEKNKFEEIGEAKTGIGSGNTEYFLKLWYEVDYLDKIKAQQRNWIGRSEGAEVKFRLANHDKELVVYTTRPDTLFGATYMVVAPEHPIIKELESEITNLDEVKEYQRQASLKSDFERAELNKEKTGVEIKGIRAINPLTNTEIPIWVSDYVLITYGTGAIMAVPAHDTRDWEFAKKFSLPIIQVIESANENTVCDIEKEAFTDVASGKLVNSGFLTGLSVEEAKKKVIDYLEENKIGTKKVNYKLRDWVFSRQRYWGEPIPMVHCDKCGWVPLPEEELPLCLPDIEDYEPGENGESPLAKHTDWVNTTCPHCGGKATRETDTMPQWAGSSWYYLRYMDAHNDKALASKEALEYWSPVDWYNGGMEHTTLHLLYSRFWHKFLYDIGVVPTKEPYQKRTSHGMILGSNGEKMSKSKGNVINPDDIVEEFGADTFRVYEMFMGPFDQTAPWSMESIRGCNKFLDRVWNMQEFLVDGDSYSPEFEKMMHKAIKKVSSDIEEMKFNTAVSTFMTMTNEFYKLKRINKAEYKTFLQLLNPFAPHITEELFEIIGAKDTIANTPWPAYDEAKTIDDEIEIPVQVNGKVKATVSIALDTDEAIVKDKVHENQSVKNAISDKNIVKEIYVKNKIYNIVVK